MTSVLKKVLTYCSKKRVKSGMTGLELFPKIKFRVIYKKSKGSEAYWNFYNEIPEINIIAGPLHQAWKERIREEIRVFNTWKEIDRSFPFKNLRVDETNPRKFFVDINVRELFETKKTEWLTVSILIPLNYPRAWPSIGDPLRDAEFFNMLRRWTNNHPFCMPPILRTWWNRYKGRAGITHFLYAFSIFVTIAGRKSYKKRDYIIEVAKNIFDL